MLFLEYSLVLKNRSTVRYVEIGWLNYEMSAYKQVPIITMKNA